MKVEEIKRELLQQCNNFVNQKLQTIEATIRSNQQALHSETKSSAGDKHETGRAMLQLEMEKAGQQWKDANEMHVLLSKVTIEGVSEFVRLGSLVATSMGSYFIAVSAGVISVAGESYFAISPSSPIGKLLLGKIAQQSILLHGKEIQIKEVL